MKRLITIILALSFVFSTGCVTRLTDFTIISSKNIDLSKANSFKREKSRVTGEDRMWIILFIPTALKVDLKTAIDRAIQSVPGCVALVDGVVSVESWYFFIGTQAFLVEGTPLVDPSLVTNDFNSPYNICILDEKGNIKEFKQLTKEEFELEKSKF